MSRESVQIPVEYIISTTSDWTKFHIVEGGSWSEGKTKCLKGCDRLLQAVFEGNTRDKPSFKRYSFGRS